jgi:hypothetical protein
VLLHGLGVKRLADGLRAGLEDLVEHGGVQRPGRDCVDVDAVIGDLVGERLGKAHDRGLGGRVGRQHGQRRCRTTARELDDLAPLGLPQMVEREAHRQDRPHQVDLDGADPLGPDDLVDCALGPVDARVVDQDVEPAQFLGREGDQLLGSLGHRDVSRVRMDLAGGGKLVLRRGQRCHRPRADDDARTFAQVGARDLQAQALRPAGDQRGATLQCSAHTGRRPTEA